MGHPPPGLTATVALSELCAPSGLYAVDDRADLASYSRPLVSRPPKGTVPVPMEKLLGAKMCFFQILDLTLSMPQTFFQVNHGLFMVKRAEHLKMKNGF